MQVAGLGLINSLKSSGNKFAAGDGAEGFTSMLAGLMGGKITAQSNEDNLNGVKDMTEAELAEFLALFNTDQLLDLENGLELFSKIMMESDQSLLQILSEEMGITLEELGELLTKLLASFKQEGKSGASEEADAELDIEMEGKEGQELQNMELAIMQMLEKLAAVKSASFNGSGDRDFLMGMKAVKLFDLLSAHQDIAGKDVNLKDFLKSFHDGLQELMSTKSAANREMAFKLFSGVSEELSDQLNSNATGLETFKPKTEGLSAGFLQFQQMAKPEQLTLMLSQNGKPVSTQQLMQQFESILAKSHLMKNGETQRLFIKLNPEHLGALRIELIQKDSTMIARILTSTAAAKEALDANLNGLKNAFSAQNLQVEKVEITQQMNQQERFFHKEQQSEQERQQSRQPDKQQQETENSFGDSFEEALLNTEA